MSNREWVTLHILWKVVLSHHSLWPTGSEWWCTFCERQPHHIGIICMYEQQEVSNIVHLVKGPRQSHHIFSYDKQEVSHCTFCERQSHHIFSNEQQFVSDIAHFVKGSLITSFPMPSRLWVTLHILWTQKPLSSHFFMTNSWWVTFHFLWRVVSSDLSYDEQLVSNIAHFVKGITPFPYDPQQVSEITHFVKCSLITFFLWLTACEWHFTFCAIFKSHSFPWPPGSEWDCTFCERWTTWHVFLWLDCEQHCTFCERQPHQMFSYDKQDVSDIQHIVRDNLITRFPMTKQRVSDLAYFVIGSLITSFFPMTNSLWVRPHIF